MSRQLLSVEDCRVSFGAVTALNGASLAVGEGEAIGIVGPLTSGKTTLLRVVAGLVSPASGKVRFRERDIRRVAADARARHGIVHVPADGGFFPSLSVRENLLLAARDDADGAAVAYVTQLFPVLGERLGQRAGSLSGGEQRQLAIARGALARPVLLLLDEPLLGLSPRTIHRVATLLTELRRQGVALVVVEERPSDDLQALVDRLVGLRAGRVVAAEEVRDATAARSAAVGALDLVDVEVVAVPLSVRDRRALQTIASTSGETVGAVLGRLVHEHVEQQQEVWQ